MGIFGNLSLVPSEHKSIRNCYIFQLIVESDSVHQTSHETVFSLQGRILVGKLHFDDATLFRERHNIEYMHVYFLTLF